MKKKYLSTFQNLFSKSLLFLLLLVMVINVLVPDKKTSYTENRTLAQFPDFSIAKLQSGTFNKDLSKWFSDQFVGRDAMIQVKYIAQKLSGQKEINGVYLTRNGLIEDIEQPNQEQLERKIDAINDFYRLYKVPTTFLLAPNNACVNRNRISKNAPIRNQQKLIDNFYDSLSSEIECIDVSSTLKKHNDEYLYYKTDHHWTSLGAYYGFTAYASQLNLPMQDLGKYQSMVATKDFKGTLASKVGSIGLRDEIDLLIAPDTPNYLLTNISDGSSKLTVYSSEGLESNNPYDVFFGGNHALIQLELENESKKHLLIFKDSYANSLIPFLLPYYRTITILDPRYCYDDITQIMEKYLITEVLYCYNANTFFTDTSLADVIEYNHEAYGIED